MKKSLLIYIGLGISLAQALGAEGLSLQEAWVKVQASSPELLKARAALAAQEASVGSAKAFLYPRLDWQYLQDWDLYSNTSLNSHSDRVRLRQDFTIWGGKLALIRAAGQLQAASQQRLESERRELFMRLAQAYFNVAAEQADAERLNEQLKINDERVRELTQRERQGRIRKSELASAKAQASLALAQMASQQGALDSAQAQLFALGAGMNVSFKPISSMAMALPSQDDFEAIEGNPQLKALSFEAEAADLAASASRSGFWPTLEGQLSRGLEPRSGAPELSAGLTLNWEFFSGFATLRSGEASDARAKLARAELDEGRRELRLRAHLLHRRLRSRQNEISALQEAVLLTQQALKETERDYRYSQATLLELTQATQSYIDSARRLDRATCNQAAEKSQLDALLGNLP